MINNTSIGSPATPIMNTTPDGLRLRRMTTQAITQVTNALVTNNQVINTQEAMKTGPCYECYKKPTTRMLAGATLYGMGYGMVVTGAMLGIALPGAVAVGVGYGAFCNLTAKATYKALPKLNEKIRQTDFVKNHLKCKTE